MAYVKNGYDIGDKVVTAYQVGSLAGYFEKGTEVRIVGVSERGYDLMDEYGNRVIETGWDSVRKFRKY